MKNLDLSEVRKQLHRIPELAFEEFKTRDLLMNYLDDLDGFVIHCFADSTGILVEYSHGKGEYLLFRADMDALPITENTGCDFVSQHTGRMHACGHDIHMTVLLGLIYRVAKEKPDKNLLFLFQPAEEGMGGAQSILAEGLIQSFQVKHAFALHVSGKLPVNTVSAKPGIFFAIPQEFDVEFIGKSAHAAFPEDGINALKGGIDFYQRMNLYIEELQKTDSIIFNVGVLSSGTIRNIIPDKCVLQGTHRTLSKDLRDLLNHKIEALAQETALEHNLQYKFDLLCTYDPVINAEQLCRQLIKTCADLGLEYRESGIFMTGEDFGFFTSLYPSLLFWLGAGEQAHDLHSDLFLPDEKCIPAGIDIFYQLLLNL